MHYIEIYNVDIVIHDVGSHFHREEKKVKGTNLGGKKSLFSLAAVKVCSPVSSTSSSSMSSSSSSERRTIRNLPTPMPNGEPSILADRRNPRPLARGDSRVKSLIGESLCFSSSYSSLVVGRECSYILLRLPLEGKWLSLIMSNAKI